MYSLLDGQYSLFDAPEHAKLDVCVYQGGYGSGKTWAGSLLGILLAQKYPRSTGMACAKTYPLLRDTTLATYHEHCEALGLSYGPDYTFKSSESLMTFHCFGGSQVFFRHLESPEKIKSLNLAWIHVEEMSQINEADFLMLLSRLRQGNIGLYRMFGTTNPQPNKGWIYKYFAGNKKADQDGITYRRVMAPSTQNHHLSKEYLANMENQYDPDYYRINVLGQDGDYTAGLVCSTWDEECVQELRYDPTRRLYLSCDFNIDPNCWAIAHCGGSGVNTTYEFIDELCLENTATMQAAEEFCRRYEGHTGGIVLTGDASGKNRNAMASDAQASNFSIIENVLSSRGFPAPVRNIPSSNPNVDRRTQSWNAAVKNSLGVRRVKVDPKCKHLIDNCENLKYVEGTSQIWEPTINDIKVNPKLKFTKHIWDGASYLVDLYSPAVQVDRPENNQRIYMQKRY